MPVLSVRVSDDLAARFDAAASAAGGRSALLHRLVRAAGPALVTLPPLPKRRDAMRLMVRLAAPDGDHVAAEAAALALPRAAWVAALVRRHARGGMRFSRTAEHSLLATQTELRRIGVNVNQIARALNTAVMEGRVLDTELTAIDDLRRELSAHIAGLAEAFAGNLAYWAADL